MMRVILSKPNRGERVNSTLVAIAKTARDVRFDVGAGKRGGSTPALSKPDIGPQSKPNGRAAMMR